MILIGQALIDKAREIDSKAHAGQFRKDGVRPYTVHLDAVEHQFRTTYGHLYVNDGILHEDYYRGIALCRVHDTPEDAGISPDRLAGYGLESLREELVLLTHSPEDTYLAYLLKIRNSGNRLALQVKLADNAANYADMASLPTEKACRAARTKYDMARYILLHP